MNTVGSNNLSLKYLRFTSGCKDLLKFEFVATAIIPFPKKCYYKYEHWIEDICNWFCFLNVIYPIFITWSFYIFGNYKTGMLNKVFMMALLLLDITLKYLKCSFKSA